MTVRVLVAGFEPFGSLDTNPSERVLPRLAARAPEGAVVSTRVLPVSFRRAFAPVREAMENERPHAVLLLGVRSGIGELHFERMAVNWRESTQADNDGVVANGAKIDPGGPAAYFASLPVEELVHAARAARAPATVSTHAGTYVCNHTLYRTLRHCDRHGLRCRVGFVHLPLLPEQADTGHAHLDEDVAVAGLAAALERLVALPPQGRTVAGGSTLD